MTIKTKNVICPACGKITQKKEFDFLSDVIEGNTKEILKEIDGKKIEGMEFCKICR